MGMKAKTIRKVLRDKIDNWLESIEDEAVRDLAKKNTIVTGGAVASMLLGEKVKDFDLYFRNRETTLAVANYYVHRFEPAAKNGIPCRITVEGRDDRVEVVVKSAGVASEDGTTREYEYFEARPAESTAADQYVSDVFQTVDDPAAIEDLREETEENARETNAEDNGKPHYRPVFVSTNAITLSQRVQVVLRFFGDADEIHKNYDFVHCTSYWTSWNDELVLRPEAMESLLSRELRYVGSRYPICSLIRLRKFLGRGWRINAGQILKMAWQVSELDLKDMNVLRDQLTGVDAAYFYQVVAALKERDPARVNGAYLVEIIDRLF